MPIQSIIRLYDSSEPPIEVGIRFLGVGNDLLLRYSDISGTDWDVARLERLRNFVQSSFDNRIPRASLPKGHPYIRGGDPAKVWLFWDGLDVVERFITFSRMVFTDRLMFEMTKHSRR